MAFVDYSGLEKVAVRTTTYGPGIYQSQHAESVSHIIIACTNSVTIQHVQEKDTFAGFPPLSLSQNKRLCRLPGGELCLLARDSEPIRLLEIPK